MALIYSATKYNALLSKIPRPPNIPKVLIISFYMENTKHFLPLQKAIVNKFNPNKYEFQQFAMWKPKHVRLLGIHPYFINYFLNNTKADILFLLDIDAIPLNNCAFAYYVNRASNEILIGNKQKLNWKVRTNHLYAGPSALALNMKMWNNVGRPLANGKLYYYDVCELFTYAYEKHNQSIELVPALDSWVETQTLTGTEKFGIGTTYGYPNNPMFFHLFQSRSNNTEHFIRYTKLVEKLLSG